MICPLCARDKYRIFLREEDFNLLKCKNCGLIRTKVINPEKFIGAELYENEAEAQKHFDQQREQFRKYPKQLLNFLGHSRGKLLDVGCGFGWLVAEAKVRGFDPAVGLDPSDPFTKLGREKLKVDLRKTSLERFNPGEKFDVIVLNHVLEHIEKPNSFLKKVNSLLTRQGRICVACPNISSLMYFLFNKRWYGLQPGQHLWQFTPRTLAKVIENNGFEVEKIKITSLDYDPSGWKKILFRILTATANSAGLGDQIYVLARKL